jgi:hypothetical protein
LTVFIDRSGKDRYDGPEAPAGSQGNYYHGGSSLSLVFDLEGGDLPGLSGKTIEKRDDTVILLNAKRDLESLLTLPL